MTAPAYSPNVYDAAAHFLDLRYGVLPTPSGAKHPALMNWPTIARNQTRRSALALFRGHSGNVSLINRGAAKALDFDARDLFDAARHAMPDTWAFKTPNGGRICFRSKLRDRQAPRSVPGIAEYLGQGRAFVAPPSISNSGDRYEDITARVLRWYDELPGAVVECFNEAARRAGLLHADTPDAPTVEHERPEIVAGQWPRSVLAFITDTPANGSRTRNASLFRAALHAQWAGFTHDEIAQQLTPAALAVGMGAREVAATIASAMSYSRPVDEWLVASIDTWRRSIDYAGQGGAGLAATVDAVAFVAITANTTDTLSLPVRRVATLSSQNKDTAAKHLRTLKERDAIAPAIPTQPQLRMDDTGRLKATAARRHDDAATYSLRLPKENKQAGETGAPLVKVSESGHSPNYANRLALAAHDTANRLALGKANMQILAALAEHGPGTPTQIAEWTGRARETINRNLRGKLSPHVVRTSGGVYEVAAPTLADMRAGLDSDAALRGYAGRNQRRKIEYMQQSAAWRDRTGKERYSGAQNSAARRATIKQQAATDAAM